MTPDIKRRYVRDLTQSSENLGGRLCSCYHSVGAQTAGKRGPALCLVTVSKHEGQSCPSTHQCPVEMCNRVMEVPCTHTWYLSPMITLNHSILEPGNLTGLILSLQRWTMEVRWPAQGRKVAGGRTRTKTSWRITSHCISAWNFKVQLSYHKCDLRINILAIINGKYLNI